MIMTFLFMVLNMHRLRELQNVILLQERKLIQCMAEMDVLMDQTELVSILKGESQLQRKA
jgi:hypothetical protein